MSRNVDVFKFEISKAIEKIQVKNKTIITRRLIEDEIENNPSGYPKLRSLPDVPRRMAISAVVNKRSDAKVYGKRPVSWVFDLSSSLSGVSA